MEAASRFEIPLSFKASLNWERAFWGDNKTSVSLYFNAHSGQPYSWTFGTDVTVTGDATLADEGEPRQVADGTALG